MRRVLLLGAIALAVVASTVLVLVLTAAPSSPVGPPHITRVFIPAIKETCTARPACSAPTSGTASTRTAPCRRSTRGRERHGPSAREAGRPQRVPGRYPIEPPQQLPRGPYNRNLLYDYYNGVLKACLESRVGPDELPPIPTRADFVVRLYVWDPYRALAPGRTLDELLQLIGECPERPPYLAAG